MHPSARHSIAKECRSINTRGGPLWRSDTTASLVRHSPAAPAQINVTHSTNVLSAIFTGPNGVPRTIGAACAASGGT